MAISSNKSPSHNSTHPRTTEEGVRKSFKGNPLLRPSKSFNPITPANSPADLRRSKEGIPTLLRSSYEFKENDKDQKRVKEPKGTKSFMAPTISAISKISPSPRKKVLSERNEIVRSSISESTEFSKMGGNLLEVEEEEMGFDSQVISEPKDRFFKPRVIEFQEVETNLVPLVSGVSQSRPVSSPNVNHKPSSSPSPLDSNQTVPHFEFKANNVNSNSKTKPFSSPSTSLAPLDSDPHVPPYDPKTNFTSPRPQFLHFKPRPRIEVLLEKEKGVSSGEGKRLEDSFSSESFSSDTENSEESLPSDSPKESEIDCSSEEDELVVSDNTQSPKPKSHSRRRFKMFPFLLVVALACLFFPVTDTPVHSPSLYKDHTFKLEGTGIIIEYAKANLDEIASNLKLWSTKTISYLSTLIPGIVEERGSINFSNVTVFNQEPLVYDEYVFKKFGTTGENDGIVEFEMVEEVHEVESQTQEEIVHAVVMETNVAEIVEPEKLDSYSNSEPIDVEVTPSSSNLDYSETQHDEVEVDLTGQNAELDSSTTPIHSIKVDVSSQTLEQDSFTPSQSAEVDVLLQTHAPTPQCLVPDVVPQHSEMDVLPQSPRLDTSDDSEVVSFADSASDFAVHYYVGGMAAVLAIIVTSAYLYVKQSKTKTPVTVGEFVQKKLVDESEAQERFSSQPTEVEMTVGESGPAMSSSCKRSLSGQKGLEKMNETQSQEKRLRYSRESLASSSSEYSYGSFTTYEKIHAKHGYGEEEVVTPVRRSSRIRQITSPSA